MKRILIVIGTRPEAIKMAPIIMAFSADPAINLSVCVTAQHRHMLDQVLELFAIVPDYDLDVMRDNQTAVECFQRIMVELSTIIAKVTPHLMLVHGDTTTTIAAAMTAFYAKVPVGHVEAGLRTYDLQSPWPEEAHRQVLARLARWHFAPSKHTAQNLYNEQIDPANVVITGNTVIDALKVIQTKLKETNATTEQLRTSFGYLDFARPLVLLTVHRHENIGDGVDSIIQAIKTLNESHPDTQFVIPMHLNPKVRVPIIDGLSGLNNVYLIEPLEYLPFVFLMIRSTVILTDSGGVQEEAPALGIPVLVLRDTTERQEVLETGAIKLIGTEATTIVAETALLLTYPDARTAMIKDSHPYGDGDASLRILKVIKDSV